MTARSNNQVLAPNIASGMNPNKDSAPLWVQNLTRHTGDGGWDTRPGAGLLARVDTSLTANKLSNQQDMGINRVLGVHSFYTSWGTKQVITLVRSQAWLGDMKESLTSKFGVVYSLFVYDTTYDSVQEHTLHRHTSDEEGKKVWQQHGHYDTDIETDRQQWVDAGASNLVAGRDPIDREEAWFTDPLLGNVIFGTNKLGAWVYTPAPPTSAARTQANSTFAREYKDTESEDGLVVPLMQRGSYLAEEDGYTYYTTEEVGHPSDAVVVGSRVAFAVENTVLWSNPENPAGIVIENVDVFEENIVALGSILGVLYVCTENRIYLLSPVNGFVVSGGDLRLVSGEVGCLSPACITRFGGTLAVAHTSGVYILDGSVSLTKTSGPLGPLFDGEGLVSPWTQFAQPTMVANGRDVPQVYYRFNDLTRIGAHLTTDDGGRMFFGVPALDLTFVLESGEWHVWTFNTLVNNADEITFTNNIPNARYTCLGSDIFVVSGPTTQAQTDESDRLAWSAPNRSIAFLQIGRGGSLDRNSGFNEDKRYVAGEWILEPMNLQEGDAIRDRGYFFLEKPKVIPPGTVLDWASVTIGASEEAFYVPMTLVPPRSAITPGISNVAEFQFSFTFDNVNFEPIINTNAAQLYEVAYRLPVERLSAAPAYSLGTAIHATPEGIMVYDNATGLPDPNGDEIRGYVSYNFGGTWTGFPYFNFLRRHRNPLLSLAFKSKGVSGAIFSFRMDGVTANCDDLANPYPTGMQIWRDTIQGMRVEWNEVNGTDRQAVDWMLHGPEIASDGQMMKTQGVALRSQTSGQSTSNSIGVNYPHGLLNLAMTSSRKGLSGQATDITPPLVSAPGFQTLTHDPLVPRIGDPVTNAVFGGTPTWGDDAVEASGNVIIADTPTDNLNISGRMSGDAIRLTLYGHIRDKAERFKVFAVAAVIRLMGGGPKKRGH